MLVFFLCQYIVLVNGKDSVVIFGSRLQYSRVAAVIRICTYSYDTGASVPSHFFIVAVD